MLCDFTGVINKTINANLSRDEKYTIFKSGFKSFVSWTLGYHLSLGTSYLTVFTGLFGYSRCIYKIYMKMANKQQISSLF